MRTRGTPMTQETPVYIHPGATTTSPRKWDKWASFLLKVMNNHWMYICLPLQNLQAPDPSGLIVVSRTLKSCEMIPQIRSPEIIHFSLIHLGYHPTTIVGYCGINPQKYVRCKKTENTCRIRLSSSSTSTGSICRSTYFGALDVERRRNVDDFHCLI